MTKTLRAVWTLLLLLRGCVAYGIDPSTEVTGLIPKYTHLTQRELIPAASELDADAATRPGASPHDRVRFASSGDQTAYFYYTYPRSAAINRFEIAVEGQSDVATGYVCMRAAFLVTPDGQNYENNTGGTHAGGGTPTVCGGDCNAGGTVSECEALACQHHATNGLDVLYPGNGGSCPALASACTACDLNGDSYVTSAEATTVTSTYYAYGCPSLPNWEGQAINTADAVATRNLYGTLDVVRAYRDAVSDVKCLNGQSEQTWLQDAYERSVTCSGLPGVIVLQRYTTGCANNAAGNFDVQTIHVKHYANP